MKIANEKGVSLIALAITLIVMSILAVITLDIGSDIITKANLQNINTNMMLIQAKTKIIAEQAKFNSDTSNYKGKRIIEITNNSKVNKLCEDGIIDNQENYYLLSQNDLNSLGLEKIDIEDGYIVNYETEEVIYVAGFKVGEKIYYKLSETKDLTIE